MEQVIRSVYELDKKKLAKELIESFSIIKDEEMLLEIFQRMVLFIDNVHRNDWKESIIDVLKGEDIMPIVMEQWIEERKERGRKEGRAEGREKGREEGRNDEKFRNVRRRAHKNALRIRSPQGFSFSLTQAQALYFVPSQLIDRGLFSRATSAFSLISPKPFAADCPFFSGWFAYFPVFPYLLRFGLFSARRSHPAQFLYCEYNCRLACNTWQW